MAYQARLSILATNSEALFLHEGDSALLRRIERVTQGALPIDRVSKIVPDVGVDLVNGWSPLEIDIYMRRGILEYWTDGLIAKERLGVAQRGRI